MGNFISRSLSPGQTRVPSDVTWTKRHIHAENTINGIRLTKVYEIEPKGVDTFRVTVTRTRANEKLKEKYLILKDKIRAMDVEGDVQDGKLEAFEKKWRQEWKPSLGFTLNIGQNLKLKIPEGRMIETVQRQE